MRSPAHPGARSHRRAECASRPPPACTQGSAQWSLTSPTCGEGGGSHAQAHTQRHTHNDNTHTHTQERAPTGHTNARIHAHTHTHTGVRPRKRVTTRPSHTSHNEVPHAPLHRQVSAIVHLGGIRRVVVWRKKVPASVGVPAGAPKRAHRPILLQHEQARRRGGCARAAPVHGGREGEKDALLVSQCGGQEVDESKGAGHGHVVLGLLAVACFLCFCDMSVLVAGREARRFDESSCCEIGCV